MSTNNSQRTDTLIIVCCHAIYLDGPSGPHDEKNWLIESFQAGETPTFVKHIEEGVKQLSEHHEHALLTFSGGATKSRKIHDLKVDGSLPHSVRPSMTEAESYHVRSTFSSSMTLFITHVKQGNSHFEEVVMRQSWLIDEQDVARALQYFGYDVGDKTTLRQGIVQERFATDSYQNLLLALLQYPIWTARRGHDVNAHLDQNGTVPDGGSRSLEFELPRRVIIVSHEFKRARFLELHVPAIMALLEPLSTSSVEVEYVGINPPFDEQKIREIEEGDRLRGYGVWKTDLHGTGSILSKKRLDRGWNEDDFLREMDGWYSEKTMQQMKFILKGMTRSGY